ncbi:MAG: hypothetical protein K2X54_19160 [Methylobacterium organophilum]|nr:hypothetical protein [Methylobacterium organophilum]
MLQETPAFSTSAKAVVALMAVDTYASQADVVKRVADILPDLPPHLAYETGIETTQVERIVDRARGTAQRILEPVRGDSWINEERLGDRIHELRLAQRDYAGALNVQRLGSFEGFYLYCDDRYANVLVFRDGDCLGDDEPLVWMPYDVTRAEVLAIIKGWRAGYERGAADGADEVRVAMKRVLQIA